MRCMLHTRGRHGGHGALTLLEVMIALAMFFMAVFAVLGLVSNTSWSPAMHDADLERFGLLEFLPVRVYSSTFGMEKPHPSIYRHALDRLDVAPAEAVFIGDKLDVDIAGPQKIGMRAVLLASPYRTEVDEAIVPDAWIETIDALPDVLEAWDRILETPVIAHT